MLSKGLIVKINSDLLTVKVDNTLIDCKLRGKLKHVRPLVGDHVNISKDDKMIEEILERSNYLIRPNVANVDISLIVTSIKEPNLSLNLLDKLISITIMNKIEPVILFTKMDLLNKEELKQIKKLSDYYEKIGILVFDNINIHKLKKYLSGKIVTVCGQTGAGKSTFINKLDKNLALETNEISKSLGRGKHTTRIVSLFQIEDFYIIDTPGFSSIDISIYDKLDIKSSFYEFKNKECKYNDCMHINEDGCIVKELVNLNKILPSRYENYVKFIKECK